MNISPVNTSQQNFKAIPDKAFFKYIAHAKRISAESNAEIAVLQKIDDIKHLFSQKKLLFKPAPNNSEIVTIWLGENLFLKTINPKNDLMANLTSIFDAMKGHYLWLRWHDPKAFAEQYHLDYMAKISTSKGNYYKK